MRIQHNITALNAHRNLTNNNSSVGKNLEKLSSGYKINRAGDDAAGLAISEKMRAQITGLETAQKNAEDGVALVQTAEGALTEVHSQPYGCSGYPVRKRNLLHCQPRGDAEGSGCFEGRNRSYQQERELQRHDTFQRRSCYKERKDCASCRRDFC